MDDDRYQIILDILLSLTECVQGNFHRQNFDAIKEQLDATYIAITALQEELNPDI